MDLIARKKELLDKLLACNPTSSEYTIIQNELRKCIIALKGGKKPLMVQRSINYGD